MSMKLSDQAYGFGLSPLFHPDYVEHAPMALSQKGLEPWLEQQHGLLARYPGGIVYYSSCQHDQIRDDALHVYGLKRAGVVYVERYCKALAPTGEHVPEQKSFTAPRPRGRT